MSYFSIRTMEVRDITAVRRLWEKAGFELTKSDEPDELRRMLDHNPGLCLVAAENRSEIIVGAVLGGFDGRRGWVHHLAVDPAFRRRKIGTLLMNELTRRFKEKKVVKIKLEIVNGNEQVIEFYSQIGWNLRKELLTMSMGLNE
ncbi:MAG: GNAT family N-acetyltransferase [Candidatus Odinarchaeota archaeon]